MLIDVFGSRVLETSFQRNEQIAEFVDFDRAGVRHRSAVAAQFVLGRIADPNTTVDVLAEMARALDKYVSSSKQYTETLRALVQFSQ